MNNRIANHSDGVVKHPPLFVWFQMTKEKLELSDIGASMAEVGNANLKTYTQTTQRKRVESTRTELMLNLRNCVISLPKYMLSFGTSLDCKDTDEIIDDLDVELEREEELEKATKPAEVTPGVHSKVSQKKYKNVDGKLSTNDQPIPEEHTHTPAKSKKEKAKQRKLSMELLV